MIKESFKKSKLGSWRQRGRKGSFMDQELRYGELRKISLTTIGVNLLLAIGKTTAGLISGSMAVMSDAIHTFSDVFTTLIVLAGLKASGEKADMEHPYGHFRIESMVSLFLAFLLALTAGYLGYQGLYGLRHYEFVPPSWLALGVTVTSIAAKEWMFQYTKRRAIQFQSSALMSDAWHHRSDSLSSFAVLVGLGGLFAGWWFLEPLATITVCLIILKAVYGITVTAVNQLIDKAASPETDQTIRAIATSVTGVRQIDLLRTRLSNQVIFVELEIAVDSALTVEEGHKIAETVHDAVENSDLPVEHCMVHVNPYKREKADTVL
jgi:cation diffusion facilitator family transporter